MSLVSSPPCFGSESLANSPPRRGVCVHAQLTTAPLPKQGGEDGTHNADRDSRPPATRDGHHHQGFHMKIDISRSFTVADLRSLLVAAEGTAQVEFAKTLKKDQTGTCWCGCGATTKSKFAPGHDSKFHSLAKQVARGQAEMPTEFVHDDAKADFLSHVGAERPLWAVKQAAAKLVADATPPKAPKEAKPKKAKPVPAHETPLGDFNKPVKPDDVTVEDAMNDLMALVG